MQGLPIFVELANKTFLKSIFQQHFETLQSVSKAVQTYPVSSIQSAANWRSDKAWAEP